MEYKTIRVNKEEKIPKEGAYHAILPNGNKFWHLNGQRHREDGPAVIKANGDKEWYRNGKYHRKDGPAAIYADGAQFWYLNGQSHREDGPAIIWANGNENWYLNGIHVSQKAVENPKALTINEIIKWRNIEGQRIMINIYGLEKFIFDSNPKIIDIDSHSINGHRVLLKIKGIRDQWLCCSCPSTGRTYFMRVPDRVKTCEKADEWLSGSLMARQVGRT